MHVTPPLLFSGIEQEIGTYPCRVAPSGVAMSEDGVRTEKCKKYQVTAHSTLRLGVAWQPRAMLQLAFCFESLLTFSFRRLV